MVATVQQLFGFWEVNFPDPPSAIQWRQREKHEGGMPALAPLRCWLLRVSLLKKWHH